MGFSQGHSRNCSRKSTRATTGHHRAAPQQLPGYLGRPRQDGPTRHCSQGNHYLCTTKCNTILKTERSINTHSVNP